MLDSSVFLQNYYKRKAASSGKSLSVAGLPLPLTREQETFLEGIRQARKQVRENKSLKKEDLKQIQNVLAVIGKDFTDKDVIKWLSQKTSDMFTWNDYSRAWYKLVDLTREDEGKNIDNKNRDIHIKITVCEEICYAYFRSHPCYYEESISEFLFHPPEDYTRPHGWWRHEHRLSIGEALAAYIDLKNKTGNVQDAEKILQLFSKQRPWFKYPPKSLKAFNVPYQTYSKCFDEAQNPTTIKPDSLETCIYYVQQQGLSVEHIMEEKKVVEPQQQQQQQGRKTYSLPFVYYFAPSFLYFDVFDMMKFLNAWTLFLKIYQKKVNGDHWPAEAFYKHCTYFSFIQIKAEEKEDLPVHRLHWLGITKSALGQHVTYRDVYVQTLSFLGDMINTISFTLLLEVQLKSVSMPLEWVWQANLCKELIEKYFESRAWLRNAYEKKDLKPLTLPIWPAPNEDSFYLISAFFTPAEIIELGQHLDVHLEDVEKQEQEQEENMIFDDYRRRLTKVIHKSDLGQLMTKLNKKDEEEEEEKFYALFGIRTVKPEKRPYETLCTKNKTFKEAFLEFKKLFPFLENPNKSNLPFETGLADSKFKKEFDVMAKLLSEDNYYSESKFMDLY